MSDPGGGRSLRSLARVPALIIALAWSIGLAAAVVMAPSQPWLGAVAVALAIPCLALALAIRPAVLAFALMAALLGVGRAELPASDPNAVTRAAFVAGQTATVAGRVADDSRAASGGSEVLVEPDVVLVGGVPAPNIGNLMMRWRGPQVVGFGDQINATGRLVLPRDLPSFDRRAYLAQRHAYLELDATSINVTNPSTGLTQRSIISGCFPAKRPAGIDPQECEINERRGTPCRSRIKRAASSTCSPPSCALQSGGCWLAA